MSYSIPNPSEQSNIPYGYCHCGCGQLAPISPRTDNRLGYVKGQPRKYIPWHQAHKPLPAPGELKICVKCQTAKPLSEFYQVKSGKDTSRYHSYCRDCTSAVSLEWHTENQEYVREKARILWRQNRTDKLASQRARYRENQEYRAQYARRWYWQQPEKSREMARQYVVNNPEKNRARAAVSYAVKTGKFPPAWSMVCEDCKEAQAAEWHHHKGYAPEHKKDVIALCHECHGKAHWIET